MPHSRAQLTRLLLMLLVCHGCSSSAPALGPEFEHLPLGHELPVVSESKIDSLNRYRSTVKVTTTFLHPDTGALVKTCSGVLIHHRVVLTAGHCVCAEREPVPPEPQGITLIDSRSSCAKVATVRLLTYRPMEVEAEEVLSVPSDESEPYPGVVHPNEDIQIIYKEVETDSGRRIKDTVASHADLAVIFLKQSLEGVVEPVRLAKEPARRNEQVVLVGYGSETLVGGAIGKERRYGENDVLAIKSDGSTFQVGRQLNIQDTYEGEKPDVIRKKGSYATAGDSGGPCFRKRGAGFELVGIAKSTFAPPIVLSAYTSTPRYLGWLRKKIGESQAAQTD
ncbi:trypsin-like serine protease [Hyalangium rubrum]|uniref:Trypsin-like serine protease n=1 Tax=Hyalangium rubrum TaxID=3103134 RepID=A0ABU5H0G3_9BACT|nr:trypsin-like serine protease [Hyalangium sp. s54d21]MDY7226272.1 trypsin-like serine protease [Hyalangium sp. s54d21]